MDENIDKPETWFAPAGRAPLELLQKEHLKVVNSSHLEELLNAMPDFLMILNKERQIVHVNRRLLQAFGVENPDSLTGCARERPQAAFILRKDLMVAAPQRTALYAELFLP